MPNHQTTTSMNSVDRPIKPKSLHCEPVQQEEIDIRKKTNSPLAETATRALTQIRALGFVRRGQGKVRAMLEEVIGAKSHDQQKQVAGDLIRKLEREGNRVARRFAKELSTGVTTPPPSTGAVSDSATEVKSAEGGLPPTFNVTVDDDTPEMDEQEAADWRRRDRVIAQAMKRMVEDTEKFIRLIRRDSPDTAQQLERNVRQMDAQRRAWNQLTAKIRVKGRQHPPAR